MSREEKVRVAAEWLKANRDDLWAMGFSRTGARHHYNGRCEKKHRLGAKLWEKAESRATVYVSKFTAPNDFESTNLNGDQWYRVMAKLRKDGHIIEGKGAAWATRWMNGQGIRISQSAMRQAAEAARIKL